MDVESINLELTMHRNGCRIVAMHQNIYGSVSIPSAVCPRCKFEAFVIDGKFSCCGVAGPKEQCQSWKVHIQIQCRKTPSKARQRAILKHQGRKCFYCRRQFGSWVEDHGSIFVLKIHWDHLEPFSYSSNNGADNFVAACHICNLLKSSSYFASYQEAVEVISERWREHEYKDLPRMPNGVQKQKKMANLLQPEVPLSGVGAQPSKSAAECRKSRDGKPLDFSAVGNCATCGVEFKKSRPWSKFCSHACRSESHYYQAQGRENPNSRARDWKRNGAA